MSVTLIRYCSRPPLSLSRLHKDDNGNIIYRIPEKEIYDQSFILLKPLDLIHKIAEIIPQPYVHRHVYYGVLAPNSKLRKKVVLSACADGAVAGKMEDANKNLMNRISKEDNAYKTDNEKSLNAKKKSCCIWAILIARIYEVMPLVCTRCGSVMEIISFITEKESIEQILNHIGEPANPPYSTRSPPEEIYDKQPLYIN